ncbi:hypothetical protein BGX31_000834, partial [Mortierella sp. GBA43]
PQPQQHQQPYTTQQQELQRLSRKRSCDGGARYPTISASSSSEPATEESSVPGTTTCPRLQTQKLSLPRKQCESSEKSLQETYSVVPQCLMEPNALAKANFVECLVDTAAIVIESIWPPLPTPDCLQKQKGLPLRTFIQETLKRSRSSYSTLQTALFYLYKIRNKVPCAYLKRRQDQLYLAHPALSQSTSAVLMTPPASPHPQSMVDLQGADYFSLRAPSECRPILPSPSSSTGTSPVSVSGLSPCSSSASPSSTSSSPASSSSSPCSVSSSSSGSSAASTSSSSSSSSSPSNRIIYCGRRTFLASLMVASKYLQDRNYSNKAWAKISGLSIKEINSNELIFLKLIDYSLFVSHETFMRWTALLVAHGQEATRKFLQTSTTADAAAAATAAASAFAARAMAVPPVVLDSRQIRYPGALKAPMPSPCSSPSKPTAAGTASTTCWSQQSPEEPLVACAVQNSKSASDVSRCAKMARTSAYLPIQSHSSNSSNSNSNSDVGETVVF